MFFVSLLAIIAYSVLQKPLSIHLDAYLLKTKLEPAHDKITACGFK